MLYIRVEVESQDEVSNNIFDVSSARLWSYFVHSMLDNLVDY